MVHVAATRYALVHLARQPDVDLILAAQIFYSKIFSVGRYTDCAGICELSLTSTDQTGVNAM